MPLDIAAVKQANPLEPTIERLTGLQPEKHKIACPFHADSTPSLHIYDDGHWKCFGCGKSGDVLDFVGLYYFGVGYDAASHLLEVVDRLSGLGIRPMQPADRPIAKSDPKPSTTFDLADVALWHDMMPSQRRQYWYSRGFEDETIDAFRLGWDGKRYTIPVTYRGVCYAIKRRKSEIDDGLDGKYVMAKGSRVGLFNADILSTPFDASLPLFVVEGEIEAMLLHQLGYQAVSSTGGASTWKEHWARFLAHIPHIVVIYDNDQPGQEGAGKVRASIRRAHIWHWPDGYNDGGEFLPTPEAWDWITASIGKS